MNISILGISLVDIGLREAMRKTDVFFRNGAMNTISYISTKKLVQASEDPKQKLWLEALDMTICEDVDILNAAGITSWNRIKEVEENEYFKEFLKRVARNHFETYLLADTAENLERLEEELRTMQSNLSICGRGAVEQYSVNKDSLINDINEIAPMVIISRLPYPDDIHMMYENRMLINSEAWISLPEKILTDQRHPWTVKMTERMYTKLFRKKVNRYQGKEAE